MSAGKEPADAGGSGLLRGGRSSRSYGSLVRSNLSPVRRRHIEHPIKPGETLQGLALKYGVTGANVQRHQKIKYNRYLKIDQTEQIKRVNRLYTNDSIFLKRSLFIPVPSHSEAHNAATDADNEEEEDDDDKDARLGNRVFRTDNGTTASPSCTTKELTAADFFSRLDSVISESKRAAARRWQDAEKRLADLETICSSRLSERPRSPSGRRQRAPPSAAAVPPTTTKLTMKLREREDDMFEL